MRMNSIEMLMDDLERNKKQLADKGYSVFLFVGHDTENTSIIFGAPNKILVGNLVAMTKIKEGCIKSGMTEDEFKKMFNAARIEASFHLCFDTKEKKENE